MRSWSATVDVNVDPISILRILFGSTDHILATGHSRPQSFKVHQQVDPVHRRFRSSLLHPSRHALQFLPLLAPSWKTVSDGQERDDTFLCYSSKTEALVLQPKGGCNFGKACFRCEVKQVELWEPGWQWPRLLTQAHWQRLLGTVRAELKALSVEDRTRTLAIGSSLATSSIPARCITDLFMGLQCRQP